MGDSSNFPDSVELGRMAPCIAVSNVEKSVAFYASMLGMRKTFENGNPVGFVIMKKDRAELHLSLCRDKEATALHNVVHLKVSDANALYESSQQVGSTDHQGTARSAIRSSGLRHRRP